MTTVLIVLFWVSAGLIVFTHFLYPAVLWVLGFIGLGSAAGHRRRAAASRFPAAPGEELDLAAEDPLPTVSLVIAAYNEEAVIKAKVENARALDYPPELLEVIVASDGSTDRTVELAEAAGADLVLDLPRGGKLLAQNAAAGRARGEILAFSDANSTWENDALRELIRPFGDPEVGYVCGRVDFIGPTGGNLEGLYWSWEMKVRTLESDFAGVTAGNGAIYAVRSSAYLPLDASGSHDLSFPFLLAKSHLFSLYRPAARAAEKVVPDLEGELARKRRMMVGIWDIVVGEGMIDPRGYRLGYAFEIFSHRVTRYATPFLHLVAFATNAALLGQGAFWVVLFGLQVALLIAALVGRRAPLMPFRLARYYVMTTAAIALGLWDRWRQGPPGTWEKAEGTR
jgi:cellulose synthase/poly-beta-1,6-N-acetylglucosamine synthase-like glycosyltransferase